MRKVVPGPGPDRLLAPEIEAAVELVSSGALAASVESAIGGLD
jgi:histidine ammonia-lyase